MNKAPAPKDIVLKMLKEDHFSKWLNLELMAISKGSCTLSMKVTKIMLNGFQIAHGGICYSLADSCLAFAANSYGFISYSINTSIKHLVKVNEGDTLIATSKEKHLSNKNIKYEISIENQLNELVAVFTGEAHVSSRIWTVD
ncbi:MAG: hotdog fold thioesterase [Flavobacteriales bacterium]|jgi:acyl-CoA thioesterase|nr:hotdog fold thioesterase [Flavobacteriales bacterium]